MNKVLLGLSLIKAKFLNQRKPFLVQFSVTNNCDSHCTYCYARYYERWQEDLSAEQVFKIIDQLAEAGTWRINLVGGEPLLRKDIGEIIDYVKKNGMECAMTSNGHLAPRKIEEIKSLDLLCISLDGERKAHDTNRGDGSFAKVIKALEIASARNIPLQIATVLTKENLNSLDFLFGIARKYNANIGFTTLITQSSEGNRVASSETPSDEEYRRVLKEIIDAKKNGAPVLFSMKSFEYCLNWPLSYAEDKIMDREPDFKYIPCLAGRYYGIIDANSDVYPCPPLVGQVPTLNCLKDGFRKAWEQAGRHNCRTCNLPCNNDFNLLFALDPTAIMNILKTYKRPVAKQGKI